jgi:UDP-N-acetylmuramoyl-tripeptide--D-alanyl-D-alanine ligase
MHKPSTLKQLFHNSRRYIAKKWLKYVKPYTIGITGSMGKTYTTYILSKLFPQAISTDINLDTLYNIPITVLKLKRNTKLAILEYGIDQIGEMDRHLEIAKPNIVIITGITGVHTDSEHLGSLENLIKEKRKLIECLGEKDYAILNYDDENVRKMAPFTKAKVLFFGSVPNKCVVTYNPKVTKITLSGTNFGITDQSENITFKLNTKLFGSQFAYNLMAAYLAFSIIEKRGNPDQQNLIKLFQDLVSRIEPLKGRMSFEKVAGFDVIDDSLRSNPLSIRNGLETFALLKLNTKQRKIIVLGEMGELGSTEDIEHQSLGKFITKTAKFDLYIGIGPLQEIAIKSSMANGVNKNKVIYTQNTLEAGLILKTNLHKGDVIYLKGSLLRHMERILMIINQETVYCDVVSCPFYNSCKVCKYRNSGYTPK